MDVPITPREEPQLFVNRELSWLQFNRRVLLESLDARVPLLERLKFAAIFFSNLDEFFMVRVGSLTDQSLVTPELIDDKTGMNAHEQIEAIIGAVNELSPLTKKAFDAIRRDFRTQNVDFVDFKKISKVEELITQRYFAEEIKPLLSPQVVDRHHPFPFLKNKEQYVVTSFATKNAEMRVGIVPISHLSPIFIFSIDSRKKVAFTSNIVCHNAHRLYTKYEVAERLAIRVTRNADITVDEGLFDYDVDFRGIMQEMLKKRRRLSVVRVQMSREPSEKLRDYFCQKLAVKPAHIMARNLPLDFSFGFSLGDSLGLTDPALRFPEVKPTLPVDFSGKTAIRYLSENDLLLAYPFHSMKPFIDLLYEAADDAAVVSIKISLYRLANHSRVVSALAYAAEKGKEIICVLELRARFDEQNNIDYAKLLEDAGCTVIYGLSEYKIHAKLCVITRRQHGKIATISMVGTGNLNEKTAEQYTDLALLTTDEAVGQDVTDVFNALCMGEVVEDTRSLWVAPNCYLTHVLAGIQGEIDAQNAGMAGYVGIKVNSLNDMEVMQKLIEASQAGVEVELFIRGICCLRPGVPGYTDHIRVQSIVGRYLEHSRIFLFGQGGRQRMFIGSGDLLNRNTRRRVEAFAPIRSSRVRADILKLMELIRQDNTNTWRMLSDGSYVKSEPEDEALSSQLALHDYFFGPLRNAVCRRSMLDRVRDGMHRLWGTK